jgi:acetyl-CoA acetyltransferase
MPEPIIAGIGESQFSRRSPLSFAELQIPAIEAAMADAGLGPGDIDTVLTDGEVMPGLLGIDAVEGLANLTNVQATGMFSLGGTGLTYATKVAAERIRAGLSDAVLIYFGVDWGSSPGGPYAFHDRYPMKGIFEEPYGFFGQPTYVAAMTTRYAFDYGIPLTELKLAMGQLAVDQRANALRNPNAQVKVPLTMDQYLEAKPISSPLAKFDCCLITDGAAAFVITRDDHPRRTRRDHEAVIIGEGYAGSRFSEQDFFTQNTEYPRIDPARPAAQAAFRAAGIKPSDLDFLELYDCFTTLSILQLEELGLCAPGEGWKFVREGTAVGSGRLALNTHGGCLSHAYLLGVTHITEAARQLRGEAGDGQVSGAQLGAVSLAPGHDHATIVLAAG